MPAGTDVFLDEPLAVTVAREQYALGDVIAITVGFTDPASLIEANAYPEHCGAIVLVLMILTIHRALPPGQR